MAQPGTRLAGIEGVRAVAATSILVYHGWLYTAPNGAAAELGPISRFLLPYLPVGVTLFFTLSGFLLYRPLAASVLRETPLPYVGHYLRNRALRIVPAYWVILLVIGVLVPAALVRPSSSALAVGWLGHDPVLLARNVLLLQHYFPDSLLTGIQPTWSLAAEVVFYLLLPLLGWVAVLSSRRARTRWGRTGAALVPAVVLFMIGLSHKMALSFFVSAGTSPNTGWSGDWYSVIVRSFWGQADLFAFGMVLAVLWVDVEDGLFRLPNWWRRATAAALLLVAVPTVILAERGVGIPYEKLLALACALLLALVVLPGPQSTPPSALVRLLETRLFVAVGLASYSLFLWHEPIAHWLRVHGLTLGGAGGFAINLFVLGTLSGLLSALTYRYVERPALGRKVVRLPSDSSSTHADRDPGRRRERIRL